MMDIPFGLIGESSRCLLEQYKICQILDGDISIHGVICYTHLLIGHPFKNMKYNYNLDKYDQTDIDNDGYKWIETQNFYTKTQPITQKQAQNEIGIPIPQTYPTYKIHIITYDNLKQKHDPQITQSTRKNKSHIIIPTRLNYTGRCMVICNAEYFNYLYLLLEDSIK